MSDDLSDEYNIMIWINGKVSRIWQLESDKAEIKPLMVNQNLYYSNTVYIVVCFEYFKWNTGTCILAKRKFYRKALHHEYTSSKITTYILLS